MRGIPKPGNHSFLNDPALEARARMSDAELNRALNEENAELRGFVETVASQSPSARGSWVLKDLIDEALELLVKVA